MPKKSYFKDVSPTVSDKRKNRRAIASEITLQLPSSVTSKCPFQLLRVYLQFAINIILLLSINSATIWYKLSFFQKLERMCKKKHS